MKAEPKDISTLESAADHAAYAAFCELYPTLAHIRDMEPEGRNAYMGILAQMRDCPGFCYLGALKAMDGMQTVHKDGMDRASYGTGLAVDMLAGLATFLAMKNEDLRKSHLDTLRRTLTKFGDKETTTPH